VNGRKTGESSAGGASNQVLGGIASGGGALAVQIQESPWRSFLTLGFLACLLGNFVDQFDLYLFSSLRVTSLKSLGLDPAQVMDKGVLLLNSQMIGMLAGGVIAGVLGDKRGRYSILFGSILLYSVANVANAFVTNVEQYAVCRFLAGLGLAGELGVCITVVLETLPTGFRGYGTMLTIAFGHIATIFSAISANFLSWRNCYLLGGTLGLFVLLLRASTTEPEMYKKIANRKAIPRGQFHKLFSNWKVFLRYARGVLVTVPTYYTFSILIVFAPEFGKELGILEPIRPEKYLPFNFAAVVLGDMMSGLLGQYFKTRRWVIFGYLAGLATFSWLYLTAYGITINEFYVLMTAFGFFAGYAVLSYTAAAEQFGTNLRSTVATTTPNFVRASAVIFTLSFAALKPLLGSVKAAGWIGVVTFALALISAWSLEETHGKDLDFVES